MARIAGINIPNHQHAEIALTAIFGIGRARAQAICAAAGVKSARKIKDLTDAELDRIRESVSRFTVEGDLRGERRGFARTFETGVARSCPGQRVSLAVGDGDDGVVERCVNVRDAFGDVFLDLLARARLRGLLQFLSGGSVTGGHGSK